MNNIVYLMCIAVLMIRFCLYSDIMSDHAKFELTFTKVGTIYDASAHTDGPDNSSELLIPRQFVSLNVYCTDDM